MATARHALPSRNSSAARVGCRGAPSRGPGEVRVDEAPLAGHDSPVTRRGVLRSSRTAPPTLRASNTSRSGSRHRAVRAEIVRPQRRDERPVETPTPARRASRKEPNQDHDVSHHFRIRGGPIRRDASPPSSIDGGRAAVLQHQRLHQLSRYRSNLRDRHVPDLRVHAQAPLSPRGEAACRPRLCIPGTSFAADPPIRGTPLVARHGSVRLPERG
jgi:hypothetical protein